MPVQTPCSFLVKTTPRVISGSSCTETLTAVACGAEIEKVTRLSGRICRRVLAPPKPPAPGGGPAGGPAGAGAWAWTAPAMARAPSATETKRTASLLK